MTRKRSPKKPPKDFVKKVEALFDRATANAKKLSREKKLVEDKLYELQVLAQLLRLYRRNHPSSHIGIGGLKKGRMVFAASPASADKSKFSYFEISSGPKLAPKYEAWISVQVKTLSWNLSGARSPLPLSAKHELDVAFFTAPTAKVPDHKEVIVGVSCKHVGTFVKEMVREALGIRRETALLHSDGMASNAPWLVPVVPTIPASPIFLISSDPRCKKYRYPVDAQGLYVRYLRFPI
jgi:hypothetical protein